jgi:hypothetical protein
MIQRGDVSIAKAYEWLGIILSAGATDFLFQSCLDVNSGKYYPCGPPLSRSSCYVIYPGDYLLLSVGNTCFTVYFTNYD